jgi:hypothetical protein
VRYFDEELPLGAANVEIDFTAKSYLHSVVDETTTNK